MQYLKKILIWFFVVLIIMSCYIDLKRGAKHLHSTAHAPLPLYYDQSPDSFQVISYKFQQGDQLIAVIEELSGHSLTNIDQAMIDFQALNPSADLYDLAYGQVYLLPIYRSTQNNRDI